MTDKTIYLLIILVCTAASIVSVLLSRRATNDALRKLARLSAEWECGRNEAAMELRSEISENREHNEALRREMRTELERCICRVNELQQAITADDCLERKAKEQIDAFNQGILNILSYDGKKKAVRTNEEAE